MQHELETYSHRWWSHIFYVLSFEKFETYLCITIERKNCLRRLWMWCMHLCAQNLWKEGFLRAALCAFTLHLANRKSFSLLWSVWNFHPAVPGVGLLVCTSISSEELSLCWALVLFICTMFIFVNCGCQNPQFALSLPLDSVTLLAWLPRNWLSESWKGFENALQKLRYDKFPKLQLLFEVYFSIFNIIFKEPVKRTSIIVTRKL